jgi:capsular exopolysaccharide synthesis family protein
MRATMNICSEFSEEHSIDPRLILALIKNWAWLLILGAVLGSAGAYFYTRILPPIYSASTTVLVNEAPTTRAPDYNSIMASERVALTYAEMMKTRPLVNAALQRLGIPPEMFSGTIIVRPIRTTQLLTVTVEDTNPKTAADVANTLVKEFSETIRSTQTERYAASKDNLQSQMTVVEGQMLELKERLDRETDADARARIETRIAQSEQSHHNLVLSFEAVRLAEAQAISSAVTIEEAVPALFPIRPNLMKNVLLAAVAGLIISVVGIFLYEMLDDTIKDPDEITRCFELPVLAVVISHAQEKEGPITHSEPYSAVSEAFRSLRTSVQMAGGEKPVRRILVTSALPADGKTTVAANLAVVMANSGQAVTIIDNDLHRPFLHKLMRSPNQMGMSNLFSEPSIKLENVVQPTGIPNLTAITSGPLPPNPSELLGSMRMIEILESITSDHGTVVIDSPPVLAVTDAVLLSRLVDAVILVVKPGNTNYKSLRQTIVQLRRAGANLMGVVFNEVPVNRARYSYYIEGYHSYYPYGNGYGKYSKNGKAIKSCDLDLEVSNIPVVPYIGKE